MKTQHSQESGHLPSPHHSTPLHSKLKQPKPAAVESLTNRVGSQRVYQGLTTFASGPGQLEITRPHHGASCSGCCMLLLPSSATTGCIKFMKQRRLLRT